MFINGKLGAGEFLRRPNRFLIILRTLQGERRCHIRDPGRLSELLRPGAITVFLERDDPRRETKCELLLVWDRGVWTVVNSGLHSDLAQEIIEAGYIPELAGYTGLRREVKYGRSRLDFLLKYPDKEMLLEVKGCTLVRDGVALFPDAPTVRGRRHVLELIRALNDGYDASLLFLVMRPDASAFSPNYETDPEFARVIREARAEGVRMFAITFSYRARRIEPVSRIPVILSPSP